MASEVEIANRALQLLGASFIVDLADKSNSAIQMNKVFNPIRLWLLRIHIWSFAIKRASLPADATPPAFGRNNAFLLPADWIRTAPRYPEENREDVDWEIEGRKILTNDSGPLEIRYGADITDTNLMDPLFREALSAKMAEQAAEALTQSNSKKTSGGD